MTANLKDREVQVFSKTLVTVYQSTSKCPAQIIKIVLNSDVEVFFTHMWTRFKVT